MPEPSPAAQEVLDAFLNGCTHNPGHGLAFEADRNGLAAVIRAVAYQVLPIEHEVVDGHLWYEKSNPVRDEFLAIADELEG